MDENDNKRVIYIRPGGPQPTAAELEACEAVVLVSEPFWMQDIRAALKSIEAARLTSRARSRPADSGGESVGD